MYRLYLDEMGGDALTHLDDDKHRYLSLTGVVMQIKHARDYLDPAFARIKAEIFDHDHDHPICFHRSDIWNCSGPFHALKNEAVRREFDERILQVMSDAEYKVITVFLDKKWMTEQEHWERTHPYHFLMEVMTEKYAQFLRRMDAVGDIMPEARGKPQDKALESEFLRCKEVGTQFVSKKDICRYVPSNILKFRTKKDNIAGLQLCDLIAHPSNYTIRQNLGHDVKLGRFAEMVSALLVNQKYDRSWRGDVRGYGFKHIP